MKHEKRLTDDLKERIAIYRLDPAYYREKGLKRLGGRAVDIAIQFIDTDRSLEEVGKSFGISPERVRQIYVKFLRYVFHSSLRKKTLMEKNEKPFTPRGVKNPINEEIFSQVKALLAKEQNVSAVARMVKRAASTVQMIAKAQDLEEYRVLRRAWKMKYFAPKHERAPKDVEKQEALLKQSLGLINEIVAERKKPKDPLTQKEFDLAKAYLYTGATTREVAHLIRRGGSIILDIRKSDSLEDYMQKRRVYFSHYTRIRKDRLVPQVETPSVPVVPIPPPAPDTTLDLRPPAMRLVTELSEAIDALVKENEELKERLAAISRALGTA